MWKSIHGVCGKRPDKRRFKNTVKTHKTATERFHTHIRLCGKVHTVFVAHVQTKRQTGRCKLTATAQSLLTLPTMIMLLMVMTDTLSDMILVLPREYRER